MIRWKSIRTLLVYQLVKIILKLLTNIIRKHNVNDEEELVKYLNSFGLIQKEIVELFNLPVRRARC